MSATLDLRFDLHPKQLLALQSPATEILFGGAAGPGKSHLLRVVSILWAWMFPGLQVYLFRRISDDLVKNHVEGPKGYRALLAPWTSTGHCALVEDEVRFANGSKIYLCHCKEEKHVYKYQGAEIHVLLVDELTHFTDAMYRFLRSRVRMVGMALPDEVRERFPRILAASNPGNIGHLWAKSTFIDGAEPFSMRRMPEAEGGMLRQFIPAVLSDNPSLLQDDPSYRTKLRGLGSEALVRAMEDGDWNQVEGAFFDCWQTERHVLRPFELPKHWLRFRSFDWGYAKPFSAGWWAVASEDTRPPEQPGIIIPRGALIRYREWYGATKPDVGVRLEYADVAAGITQRSVSEFERGIRFAYSTADPAVFAEDGGPSAAAEFAKRGIVFTPADNSRIPGWQQLRQRLRGDPDGRPMLYAFSTCVDSIRTLPALQHDQHRPEDLDTNQEDHAADDWRYACMSRPWMAEAPKPAPDPLRQPTLGDLTKLHTREWQNRRIRI